MQIYVGEASNKCIRWWMDTQTPPRQRKQIESTNMYSNRFILFSVPIHKQLLPTKLVIVDFGLVGWVDAVSTHRVAHLAGHCVAFQLALS